jgi:hypothetical protein
MTLDDRLSTSSSSPPPSSSSRHSSYAGSQISGDEAEDYTVKVDVLTLYVRAACDNLKYGACPFCQRIFMLLMLKVSQGGKFIKLQWLNLLKRQEVLCLKALYLQ